MKHGRGNLKALPKHDPTRTGVDTIFFSSLFIVLLSLRYAHLGVQNGLKQIATPLTTINSSIINWETTNGQKRNRNNPINGKQCAGEFGRLSSEI